MYTYVRCGLWGLQSVCIPMVGIPIFWRIFWWIAEYLRSCFLHSVEFWVSNYCFFQGTFIKTFTSLFFFCRKIFNVQIVRNDSPWQVYWNIIKKKLTNPNHKSATYAARWFWKWRTTFSWYTVERKDFVCAHHMFSRILNFLFVIVFSRKSCLLNKNNSYIYWHFINYFDS